MTCRMIGGCQYRRMGRRRNRKDSAVVRQMEDSFGLGLKLLTYAGSPQKPPNQATHQNRTETIGSKSVTEGQRRRGSPSRQKRVPRTGPISSRLLRAIKTASTRLRTFSFCMSSVM
jgi:hypothetical protein